MIDFEIYHTFDCIGFDLHFIGFVSYYFKNKELFSVDVDLYNVFEEFGEDNVSILKCLPDNLLKKIRVELEDYFWKSDYWQEKYLDAITN